MLRNLRSLSDPRVRGILRLLERQLAKPARRRELGHLLKAAQWMLDRREDSIRFSQVDKSKESAHFDEIREEILIDEALRRLPDEIPAAVLCHELQHAYDEMSGRPYTFEAEVRSFRAESVFLSWTRPEKVAARIKDANAWHWFGYIYRKRLEVLRGGLDLEHSTTYDFVKSYLGDAKFDGLQTAEKTLIDVRRALELKEHERKDCLQRLKARPAPRDRSALEDQLRIFDADLQAGERVAESLRRELERIRRGNPLSIG